MKAFALLVLALAAPSYGQYSARTLTRRIAPQTQRPQPGRPQAAPQQPAPAYTPPPQYQYYQPQYQAAAPAQAPARPVDPAKAAADKAKNDEKQFDYFKRRAEEGSDHAQYEVGMRYLAGRGTAPDEKLGKEYLAKAAKQGHSQAAKKLAELSGEPVGSFKPADPAPTAAPAPEPKAAEPAPKTAESK